MKKKNKLLCAGVVCLTVAGLLAGAVSSEENIPEETKPLVVVDTGHAVKGSLSVSSEFIATVEPSQQVTVFPKAVGEVLAVNFSVGDTVQEGDVLFEIDSSTLRANIAQTQAAVASAQAKAQASLEMAQQNLDSYNRNLENGTNANVIAAEAAVKAAENQLQSAQVGLSTARRVLRDHRDKDEDEFYSPTGTTYDEATRQYRDNVSSAELAVEAATIKLEQAKESLEATKAGLEDQETSINSNVKLAELNTNFSDQYIAISEMQRTLSDYAVKAPIGGIVEQVNVEAFDMASGQLAAFVISQKDAMSVTFQVSEDAVANMRIGDTVIVEKQGVTWPGKIYEISTMVNVRGGLYTVKASVEKAPFEMHSGSTIKVIADTKKADNTLLLPVNAVYFDDGNAFVYIYEGNTVRKAPVEAGISDNEHIQVISGITAGDAVVTTWNANLRDGLEVVHANDVAALRAAAESAPEQAGGEPAAARDSTPEETPESAESTPASQADSGEDGGMAASAIPQNEEVFA